MAKKKNPETEMLRRFFGGDGAVTLAEANAILRRMERDAKAMTPTTASRKHRFGNTPRWSR